MCSYINHCNPLALFTLTTFLLVGPMKWKLCKQYLLQQLVHKVHNTMTSAIFYLCLSVLWWLKKMVLQCSFIKSPICPPTVCKYSIMSENTTCIKTKHFLSKSMVCQYFWFTDGGAVAGRLLKGYQEVADDISLCLLPFGHSFPVPNLVLLWPSIVFFFLFFNASPFVPYLCVYYHTVYWFMDSTGV